MHFPDLVSPGASGCTYLPWVLVNHKGSSKSEKGLAQTRKSIHRLKGLDMLLCGNTTMDVLEVMSSAAHIICLLKPPLVLALQPTLPQG